MASDITIRINADGTAAIAGINQVSDGLGNIDKAAGQASNGGIASMAASTVQMAEGLIAGATAAAAMIDKVNDIGVTSIRARAGLDAMTNSHADEFLNKMTTATRGLVDDTDLMQKATFALSAGLVNNSDDMARLAEDGAALGRVFGGDAVGGIDSLTRALQMVGSTRGLRSLGLDAAAVTEEFDKLKGSMGNEAAWHMAVLDAADAKTKALGEAAYGTGTAVERLKVQAADAFEQFSERAAQGLEGLVNGTRDLIAALDDLAKKHPQFNAMTGGASSTPYAPQLPGAAGTGNYATGPQLPGMGGTGNYAPVTLPGAAGGTVIVNTGNVTLAPQFGPVATQSDTAFMGRGFSFGAATGGPDFDAMSAGANRDRTRSGLMTAQDLDHVARSQEMVMQDAMAASKHMDAQAIAAANASIATENEAAAAKDLLRQRQAMNTEQAFGVKGNNLAGDIGSPMNTAIDVGRKAIEDADKNKSAAQKAADLAAYDQAAKKGMDDYRIATGLATPELIKFEGVQSGLGDALAKGKIGVAQYTAEMAALEHAIEGGATSMTELIRIQRQFDYDNAPSSGKASINYTGKHMVLDDGSLTGDAPTTLNEHLGGAPTSAGGDNISGPIKRGADAAAALKDKLDLAGASASNLANSVGKVPTGAFNPLAAGAALMYAGLNSSNQQIDSMPGKLTNLQTTAAAQMPLAVQAIGTLHAPLDSATSKAQAAQQAIAGIGAKINGLVGTITISVTSSVGGGAVNGSGGSRGR